MKYVVGIVGNMIGGDFKTRFTDIQIIESISEKSAVEHYKSHNKKAFVYGVKCIGELDNDCLVIKGYSAKYHSAKLAHNTQNTPKLINFLVCKSIDAPQQITEYSIYLPEFIKARSAEDAIKIHSIMYPDSRYNSVVLGYYNMDLDSFVVPNIADYVRT